MEIPNSQAQSPMMTQPQALWRPLHADKLNTLSSEGNIYSRAHLQFKYFNSSQPPSEAKTGALSCSFTTAPAQEGSTGSLCECFLHLCHLFSRGDLLCIICALFLPQHFLFLTRCPSICQAVSSDIPTFCNKRKGREWVSLQTKLGNNQQTLCTLTAFQSFCQTQHRGRHQNWCRTADATCLFQVTTS